MSDIFDVTATWNKPSYNVGETITGTISGTNHHTSDETVTHQTVGPVNIPVVAAPSGATSTVALPAVDVLVTTPGTSTDEPVLIDTSRSVVDSSATPRTWVVSGDRKSISTVA